MLRRGALLVVDVQLDFCPGGALAVPEGDQVVPPLNRYLELFKQSSAPVFASRDWHPAQSKHFKEQGGVWPPHCVQGSAGAEFHPGLLLPEGTIVISKGMSSWDNGYSALQGVTENGTPFAMLLRRMEMDRLYVGGLATDYCVKESVLEALKEGFAVTVLTDAIRGVEVEPGDSERALQEMWGAGAEQATFASVRGDLQAKVASRPPSRTD
ncbi:nicotinamidase [Geomonas sp. Red69]|uniref:nicotinamidase n=1 Tax=Geomonas diazotrophica TaxID=2843197 RepID=UPI001C0FC8BA|nr:nicotinamidase [Geomonas diazotrophica]MBU5636293.1 nicotinamidase [Geomonas diazotrophica]